MNAYYDLLFRLSGVMSQYHSDSFLTTYQFGVTSGVNS
jgi:hypothetical protein